MAFFKFRKSGAVPEAAPSSPRRLSSKNAAAVEAETIDAMRRRARHRLIGAVMLVLAAVIGFPLVFDTQPRPVAVNAPILIPDRNEVAPLPPPTLASGGDVDTRASSNGREHVVPASESAAPKPITRASEALATQPDKPAALPRQEGAAAQQAGTDEAAARAERDAAQAHAREAEQARKEREAKEAQEAKAAEQAKARAEQREADAAARKKADDAARARALLEGRSPDRATARASQQAPAPAAATGGGRFVVQVGAYAEAAGVNAAREKAQRAGVSTFTQAVNTSAGKRTRVRAGPFASREAADQAAAKLKRAGLGASVIPL